MTERPVKRSLTLRGHRTSVSLEDPFWRAFRDIAAADGHDHQRLCGTDRRGARRRRPCIGDQVICAEALTGSSGVRRVKNIAHRCEIVVIAAFHLRISTRIVLTVMQREQFGHLVATHRSALVRVVTTVNVSAYQRATAKQLQSFSVNLLS